MDLEELYNIENMTKISVMKYPIVCDWWKRKDDYYLMLGIAKYGWFKINKFQEDKELKFTRKTFPSISLLSKRTKKLIKIFLGGKPQGQDAKDQFGYCSEWKKTELVSLSHTIENYGLPDEREDDIETSMVATILDNCVKEVTNFSKSERSTIKNYPFGPYEFIRREGKLFLKDALLVEEKCKELVKEARDVVDMKLEERVQNPQKAKTFLETIELAHTLQFLIPSYVDTLLKSWLVQIYDHYPKRNESLPKEYNPIV